MFKNYKRNLIATVVGAFLLLLAFPTFASASQAAITSFTMDRTTVTQGQTITFTVTTTAQVNYVFANVGNNRVATGTRTTGNSWSIVVTPALGTQGITVVANTVNNVNNAATLFIPITVNASGQQNVPPQVPTGPLAIHSITETPALQEGHVQLTVVTGPDAREVWARFDVGRYRRGQEVVAQRTATSRTWEINYRPTAWVPHRVEIGSNVEYTWTGAQRQYRDVTLSAPFVRPVVPVIQQVTVNPREVQPNASTTFTIRTNRDVNYVWVENVNGTRHNATMSSQTATARNWTVSFVPSGSGQTRVFANTTNNAAGAVSRNESVTVRTQNVAIVGTPTARWVNHTHSNSVWVEVTTNQFVQRVWVELSDGNRPQLTHHSGHGTANRVWRGYITNVSHLSQLNIRLSETNQFNTDYSRNVTISGVHHSTNVPHGAVMTLVGGGQGWLANASITHTGQGGTATITINTLTIPNANIDFIRVTTPNNNEAWFSRVGNTNQWTATISNFWFTHGHTTQFVFEPWINNVSSTQVVASWVAQ